ncbi:oligopeptide transport system ATP-binding protein [Aminobacter niigataensis]|uniref:Oligopeptide transport system ATP-binding protein n=1 Tax=Aminobacter niigataensis TaxID=83265 RepID=A0ABR6L1D1_9HYPH|nr:ABC transporter ATP-binding protein [Aminobacter niigataensis]MBB4650612.1 oligopeptide transport system ATP-binding protein [Aminobacter niigataensis]
MTNLLEVRNLTVEFRLEKGVVRAVDDVSFTLKRGETLGIVGESGSGKSVTSLAVMRLIPNPPGRIAGGEIIFDGKNLLDATEKEMRRIRGKRIAMIFQDPMSSLNPVLTIGRQITESLKLHMDMGGRAAELRATELLDLVGIPSAKKRLKEFPHEFSGGMRQRVMIAMALACNPELLIADEPTTALDVTIQAQILELIGQLQKELGTAVIMITHDLGVVAGMADRLLVMYAGRVVEDAPTEPLFADPRMPYTMGLLNSIPRLDERKGAELVPIPGLPPDLTRLGKECPFHPRCRFAVKGVCDVTVPPLRQVAEEHKAACLFNVDELKAADANRSAALMDLVP